MASPLAAKPNAKCIEVIMAKIGKKPTDDQLLEGGGSGSGSFAKKAGKAAEIAGITALGGYAVGLPGVVAYKAEKLQKEREEAAKTKRENTAEMKRESRGSKTSPMDQFMGELDKGLKQKGLDTSREGNNVTIKGVKKSEDAMTPGQKQSMEEAKDEEMRKKMKTAPTTKTEMGKGFAKGGMTASRRADGCAQRGKTRGTLIK
jgi:hypothetical protein